VRIIGSKKDEILTFFPDLVSIDRRQKKLVRKDHPDTLKNPGSSPKIRQQMEHLKLLMVPDNFGDAVKVLSVGIDTSLLLYQRKNRPVMNIFVCPRM
jgi:hypothetical protein